MAPAWGFDETPPQITSLDPVIREFLGNIRIHGLGVSYIKIAFRNRAIPLLGEAPSVERGGQSGIDLQRRIEIGDGILGLAALEVDETPAVQGVDEIRPQPQRLV